MNIDRPIWPFAETWMPMTWITIFARPRVRLATVASLVALSAWGCGVSNGPQTSGANSQPSAVSAVQGQTAPQTPIAVEILSWDQVEKRIEQFRGKVVVLDVWSTYCDPCIREFPNLVELQERFGKKIVCISFDTDYSGAKNEPPESFKSPVLKFLTAKNAMLVNVISSDPSEAFFNKIRLGGPPAVFVYDQAGKLVKRFDNSQVSKTKGEFTYKTDVVPLVERLVAESR